MNFPFHLPNLLLTFSTTTSKKKGLLLWHPPKRVSFAYESIFTLTSSSPMVTLSNYYFSTAFLTTPAKPSVRIRKINGARGSPCLNPLLGLNSLVGLPLTSIEIDED